MLQALMALETKNLMLKNMEIILSDILIDEPIQEHLPWHKPEIQRLIISIDTSAGVGSNVDISDDMAGPLDLLA